MTRYRGTGEGIYLGHWYRYRPSVGDRVAAQEWATAVVGERKADGSTTTTGYTTGMPYPIRVSNHARGFLGELAALFPIGSGPELEIYRGRGSWRGRADFGRAEIRTTSTFQLRGGSDRYPGLGGWRISAKDRGRIIVCVEDRDDDLVVMGWAFADDIPRLVEPIDTIVAVVEPADLRPLDELAPYAAAFADELTG